MKNLEQFISEASRRAKHRSVKFVEKMFLNGKKYANIGSFALVSPQNPDGEQLTASENKKLYNDFIKTLKQAHIKFVPVAGKYGIRENTVCLFNVKCDTVAQYAGQYNQESFFYCYPQNNELVCEYWEKEHPKQPYDSVKNKYVFINKTTKWEPRTDASDYYTAVGKDFKFSISTEVFNRVNEELETGIQRVLEAFNTLQYDDVLDYATNHVGQKAAECRRLLNE